MSRIPFTFLTIVCAVTALPIHAQTMDHSAMPGMQMQTQSTPGQAAVQQIQERENPSLITGSNDAAPELLADAMKRSRLTLEQLMSWAEAKSPTLAAARATEQRTLGQARQAALPPNPTIGYSGEHIRGGSYGGGEQGAFVQQTIVMGGKLGLHRDALKQQAAADATGIEEQRSRLRADVQAAFYSALAAQERVRLRASMMQLAIDAQQSAHQSANLGQTDAPNVLESEVAAEQAKMDYVEAQRLYMQRFRALASLSAEPDLPLAPLEGALDQIPQIEVDGTIAKLMTDSPAVVRARKEAAAADAELKSAKRESIPNLTIQAGEWYSGEQLNGTTKPAGWMGFAQAGVELPLWNRNQGATAAAQAEVARRQASVMHTELALRQQAETLAQNYMTAKYQADRYRTQMIPRAQRAYDLYSMKYQQMAAPYTQVLMSQRTLFDLQIAYTNALETAWINAASLQNYALRGATVDSNDGAASSNRGRE